MDSQEFLDKIEEEKETELDRLGSTKGLMAATNGDIDLDTVLETAVAAEHRAAKTFSCWSSSEEGEAGRVFGEVAVVEREHQEKVESLVDDEIEPEGIDDLHEYLRGVEDTVERVAAGMVGRGLVSDAALKQTVSFFTGQAARKKADRFRELREENEDIVEKGLNLLDSVCDDDEDWERATEAAGKTVDVYYDDYVESCEEIGVNPKPVC
ncbi:MAG: rubrerythrin family protein [Halobacteria archaeon]